MRGPCVEVSLETEPTNPDAQRHTFSTLRNEIRSKVSVPRLPYAQVFRKREKGGSRDPIPRTCWTLSSVAPTEANFESWEILLVPFLNCKSHFLDAHWSLAKASDRIPADSASLSRHQCPSHSNIALAEYFEKKSNRDNWYVWGRLGFLGLNHAFKIEVWAISIP